MKDPRTRIENFEAIVGDLSMPEDEAIERLAHALDALVLAAQEVVFEFDEQSYPDPPEIDSKPIRDAVAQRFPCFGYYNVVLNVSGDITKPENAVGDAIGDLEEILVDLKKVKWCLENTSEADALWHFQFGFRSHWGRHARDLQLYIHDLYGW